MPNFEAPILTQKHVWESVFSFGNTEVYFKKKSLSLIRGIKETSKSLLKIPELLPAALKSKHLAQIRVALLAFTYFHFNI